ncbi:hypothetical protein L7F22_022921 [Adiantum nelumboides]|nr:hypothetical protein [Adiantum nelumboides]
MESSSMKPPSISSWLPCSPLGSGSFGHVSLALNLENGSLFAVKSAHASSPTELLALRNELHILQTLHSPFIIHLLGSNFSPNSDSSLPLHSLFLEYMDGGSLFDALKKSGGKFQQELQVRCFTRSILQGLSYLHQSGIVHCDIKCHNILLGSSGVKIGDFGAARRLEEASTSGGNLRGTPLWMAPEVAQGAEAMPASDIWSLGCTVVEMLQGRPPWGHVGSVEAALFKIGCSKENPPLPEFISAEAKDFLSRCMQRDASARWTAAELLKHPFICGLDGDGGAFCNVDQPSPRSTLDFSSDSESESEEDGSVMMGCAALSKDFSALRVNEVRTEVKGAVESLEVSKGSGWIVVRSREGWREGRQELPFMEAGAGKMVLVRRGGKVSFASAAFLSRRRGGKVVG